MKNKNLVSTLVLLVTTLSIGFVLGCTTSPTGRKQLNLVSDKQMTQMGFQAFDQMKKETPVEKDPRTNEYVQCVALNVAKHADDETGVKNWEVVVFKDASANAFALPGGKIGVHTGLLKVATTADQLAAVLGHEVGHVIARHGGERVSQGLAAQGGLVLADLLLDKKNENRGMVMAGLGLGAQFGVILPFSRKHESEADEIGLYLMAKAGFNPEESVQLWKNMAKASGGKAPPQFLSTHPANQTRIEDLQSNMKEALKYYAKAQSSGINPACGSVSQSARTGL